MNVYMRSVVSSDVDVVADVPIPGVCPGKHHRYDKYVMYSLKIKSFAATCKSIRKIW